MNTGWRCLIVVLCCGGFWRSFEYTAAVQAAPLVVETDPLSAEEQLHQFEVPDGFVIQLVASEPTIHKPMNMAFDTRGRLWVTHSVEYPFASEDKQPRDAITVLWDFGPDGRARQAQRFAEGLNIPIGVLPLGEGRSAIVWSIPYIWRLTDTDGDGRADLREVLYGPFEAVDTHGNQNGFRLGWDGWIYACHGFRNHSQVRLRGAGPVVLTLHSGNTYRFRDDGSAIEQVSWGQVNPFGSCFDERGDWYTADCHSKPITLILRGGYYESFGKPHDGLGFVPAITGHDHGSTGIAGLVCMHTGIFPEGYRDQFFVGNVITNQVHRDVAVWRGSSPWIETPEPFLSCRDGWFRPVDLALGPEGALYIADFYNCIIGHYEVDLHHPRRDRERGRLWRVLPRESATRVPPDLTQEPTDRLWEELSADNLTLRRLAMQEWERRHQDAPQLVVQTQSALRQGDGAAGRRVELLWMLARRERLPEDITAGLLTDRSALVRVHTVRALGAMSTWTDQQRQQVLASLHDADPWVRRAAVEALGRHPQLVQLEPLLKSWQQTAIEDSQLRHAIKIALKEHLHQPEGCLAVLQRPGKIEDQRLLVEIARAVPTESAAEISLAAVRRQIIPPQEAEPALLHIARHGSPRLWDSLAEWVADLPGELRSLEVRLFQAVWRGLQERGETPAADSAIGRWGRKLATALLNDQRPSAWFEVPTTVSAEPVWGLRQRTCADGTTAWFFDSLAYAEQRVGMLRSQPFILPEQLVFWLCGHNGLPQQPSQGLNLVRLRLLDHDQVVWQAEPPRNDVAQRYVWNVQRWAGQRAVLELIDADSGGAYAWLAIGRCEPPLISPQPGMLARDEEQQFAVRLAAEWRMEELRDLVVRLAEDPWRDSWLRGEAAETLLRWRHPVAVGLLSHLVQDPQESPALRVRAAQLLGGHSSQEGRLAVATALGTGTSLLQHPFALALARSAPGAELLLAMVANGRASSRLLLDPQVQAALRQHPINHLEDRIAQLTAGLPTLNQQVEQQWRRLSQQFTLQEASAEAGAAVFRRVCANCHRLRGEGGKVGPQLDGVGNRGLERLLEDILDPNRNVDAAFRAVVVTTKQGQVYSGLKVREEGAVLVLADSQGKEVRIPTAEIDEWQQTLLSPMPSNLLDLLQENELRDLLAFLLRQRQAITGP